MSGRCGVPVDIKDDIRFATPAARQSILTMRRHVAIGREQAEQEPCVGAVTEERPRGRGGQAAIDDVCLTRPPAHSRGECPIRANGLAALRDRQESARSPVAGSGQNPTRPAAAASSAGRPAPG